MQPNLLDSDVWLPGSEDLPCSDDTPVDNENQNTLPNWLLAVLEEIWGDRQDWYFGVDMGIYDREGQRQRTPTVIPDGFLSIGVQRHKRSDLGRLSYVLREENNIVPLVALEMVSQTYGQEYDDTLSKYARLGVLYYVIYNREYSKRHQHQPFEVYKLINTQYQRQQGEPVWMPEVGLGIGRTQGLIGGIAREWLAWHDSSGQPYPLPLERLRQEQQRVQLEQQRADAEQQRAEQAEQTLLQEQQRAEQAEQALLQEQQRAEQAEQTLLQERQRAAQERQEKLQLLAKLRQLGVDVDEGMS